MLFDTHSLVGAHDHGGHTHDPVEDKFIQNAKKSFAHNHHNHEKHDHSHDKHNHNKEEGHKHGENCDDVNGSE